MNQSFDVSDSDIESSLNGTTAANHSKSKGPRARVQPRSVARKSSDSDGDHVQGMLQIKTEGSDPANPEEFLYDGNPEFRFDNLCF